MSFPTARSATFPRHCLKGSDMAVLPTDPWNRDLERVVRETLKSIRFGSITLVVQDGRVIQVDKSEKIRLNRVDYIDGSGI